MRLAIKTCTLNMPHTKTLDFCVEQGISALEIETGNWSSAPHIDLGTVLSSETARIAGMTKYAVAGLRCALSTAPAIRWPTPKICRSQKKPFASRNSWV